MTFCIGRREFITLLGGAAAAWPLAARAQQPAKVPTIGFLGAASPSSRGQWVAAFVQRLRELGWSEGRTIAIEYRWAEGRSERYAEIAAEFVRRKVDVIVTHRARRPRGKAGNIASSRSCSLWPPTRLAAGLVASLARPAAISPACPFSLPIPRGKRLELLREAVPGFRAVGDLGQCRLPAAVIEMGEVQAAARTLGLEVTALEIRRAEDIAPAFAALKDRAEALYICEDASYVRQSKSHLHICAERATADDTGNSRGYRMGRSDVLWSELPGSVPARRGLCR